MMEMLSITESFFKEQLERRIASIEGGIRYCEQAITEDIAEWEKKEYRAVRDQYQQELDTLKQGL